MDTTVDKTDVLAAALEELRSGNPESAAARLAADYPHAPTSRTKRNWTQKRALKIFRRDGFIDRYSGQRLVYPGALRSISLLLPQSFPAHPNWKMSETHMAFWELFPTLDHLLPVARGGADDESNLVTTSMLRNQAKSSWTLEELGWDLLPAGRLSDWDGLLSATRELLTERPELLEDPYLGRWHAAANS
jgi:5-methylcytosine-specific restriction endonuclease McrA